MYFICCIFIFGFVAESKGLKSLFTHRDSLRRSLEPCCDVDHSLECHDVDVDPEALHDKEDISFNGVVLKFANLIPPHGQVYKTEKGDEAVISYNNKTNSIIGTLKTFDGRSYAIEKCRDRYIFEEFDLPSFPSDDESGHDHFEMQSLREVHVNASSSSSPSGEQRTYSIMIYYTPEFAEVTPNIDDFIDQVIAETNQGYVNSLMPITIEKLCSEQTTFHDSDDAMGLFDKFGAMKASYDAIRNTADGAALLSIRMKMCGLAIGASYDTGLTFSLIKKSCALGYYSFGHEIAHNLGAEHDPRYSNNLNFPDGHGHLIERGGHYMGLRTILAYSSPGHQMRVNYYSNPKVNHPYTKTPTGVEGLSDNASVLMRNIDRLASLGNETASCKDMLQDSSTDPTSNNN